MKRKIQNLLFVSTILFISSIVLFAGIDIRKSNMSIESVDKLIKANIMADIVLPPGSTSEDLQQAVNNATSGDTIIISDNITYTTTSPSIIIPAGKEITIRV